VLPCKPVNIFGEDGVVSKFSQILAILAPFYIAALAAVSTFSASSKFDEQLRMAAPPRIYLLDKGKWEERYLTLRHFLSMLFGYCAVVSFCLFFFTIFAPIVSEQLASAGVGIKFGSEFIFFTFLFTLFHMITATLLGMYYLSDKMHR
jgi:hypothetical protein